MENIGLIGVGLMGHGIAKNLVCKGWKLNYFDHPGNQPTDDLDSAGAQKWASSAKMASICDVLILCVSGSPQVEDVLLGSGGVLDALKPGAIVVDCSTAIPSSTKDLAEKVIARGGRFIDAPMTRTPKEAEEGRLNLLVGGEESVVNELRPVLTAFSENIFFAGAVGTGHQLKLLHNIVSLGTVTLMSEIVACAAKGGVEMGALVDCLRKGGGNGVALDRLVPYITHGEVDQLRFTIENARKDFSYYNQMAEELGATNLIASSIFDTVDRLVKRGDGGAFMPEQIHLLQR